MVCPEVYSVAFVQALPPSTFPVKGVGCLVDSVRSDAKVDDAPYLPS